MDELEQLAADIAELYFVKRDFAAILPCFDPEITWVGTGKNECGCGMEEIIALFEKEKTVYPGAFRLSQERYRTLFNDGKTACVYAELTAALDPRWEMFDAFSLRFTLLLVHRDGDWRILHVHNSIPSRRQQDDFLFNQQAAREQYEAICQNLAQRNSQEMERLRFTDTLTGIPNMEGFICQVKDTLAQHPGKKYVVVKFGIKRFRYINQAFSYEFGDQIMQNVAQNLQRICRKGEVCGRIERDNFAILINFTNDKALEERMEQLRLGLLDEKYQKQLQYQVAFCAGVYRVKPGGREEVKDMLDKALLAQQAAARLGWGSHYDYFDEGMERAFFYQQSLLEQARAALEKGEFQLYIQPQVDTLTGQPKAGEALVRWRTADGRLIQPDQFIPLFEQNDLIVELDFYMLEKLCQQLQNWMKKGMAVAPISINQSRKHLQSKDYLERFCGVVDRYDIPHCSLAFELTETAFIEYNQQMLDLARSLHQRGFQLAVDDFGTGYSSLNFLSLASADILKIDRSLIADCGSPRGEVILRKVIEMAKETRMMSICEGVEKKEQWDCLKRLGCDMIQGFYFYKPMPAAEFEAKVLRGPAGGAARRAE